MKELYELAWLVFFFSVNVWNTKMIYRDAKMGKFLTKHLLLLIVMFVGAYIISFETWG